MKENWKEVYLENLVNDLNERIEELEEKLDSLEKENEYLRKRDKINQQTIKTVKHLEFEYYKKLDELKVLKEKYKKVIQEAYSVKKKYTIKFNEVIKEIKDMSGINNK